MSIYQWEPIEDTFYSFGDYPWRTTGLFYDGLHVEQTIEGWHGILLQWHPGDKYEEDYDPPGFAMVDEQVFPTQEEAQDWCEVRDQARIPEGDDLLDLEDSL